MGHFLEKTMKFEIENRTKAPRGTYAAGRWLVWRIQAWPFPHRRAVGHFATEKEAREHCKRIEKGEVQGSKPPLR
jgi:hypothetical protein